MKHFNFIFATIPAILLCLSYTSPHIGEIPDYYGEEMSYNVRISLFNIGKATILFKDKGDCNSYIRAEAESTGITRIFVTLHYLFDCCMNSSTGLPEKITRSLLENDFFVYNEVRFDHQSRKDSTVLYSQLSGKKVVPKNILDILTGFYHFRKSYIKQCLIDKKDVVLKTYFTDEVWDLRIRYAGRETINTMFGEVRCIKFKPVTIVGRFFRHDDDMTIWITDDQYNIPVRIRLELKIGHMVGELVEYKAPARN
jgi:hypothetical protein